MKDAVTFEYVIFWLRVLFLILLSMNFGWLAAQWIELRRANRIRKELDAKISVVKEILDGLVKKNAPANRERDSKTT